MNIKIIKHVTFSLTVFLLMLFYGGKYIYVLFIKAISHLYKKQFLWTSEPYLPFEHIVIIAMTSLIIYWLMVYIKASFIEIATLIIVFIMIIMFRGYEISNEIELGLGGIGLKYLNLHLYYISGSIISVFIFIGRRFINKKYSRE